MDGAAVRACARLLANLHGGFASMNEIDLIDLGDVAEETRQCTPWGVWSDSWFQWGSHEWQGGGPPHC